MKIALFTDTFLPLVDGVVTATLNLAKGLADRGHKIIIIAPKVPQKKEFKYKNIKVIRVPSIPAWLIKGYRTTSPVDLLILRRIAKEKVDIIHFQAPWTIGLQGILAAHILRKPLVGTFHTFHADPDYLKNLKLNSKVFQRVTWKLETYLYNEADLVTCPSEVTKKELLENKCSRPIHVVSNGIDLSLFSSRGAQKIRNKYRGRRLLLSVSRIAPEKNILHLLDAMQIVSARIPEALLLLVGHGPQFDEVQETIREMELQNNVILLGKIPHETLMKSGLFTAVDAFVMASKTETQGISVLEAQANKLPCVVVKAKALPALVNSSNGFIVHPKNDAAFAHAIIKLLSNDKLRKKLGENAYKSVQSHALPKILDQWEKLYKSLL